MALAGALPGQVKADAINPGFHYLSTPSGGAGVSLPVIGFVPLMGNPIGPGDTDTIIHRTGGLADGDIGTIPVELVALSLVSANPVDMSGGNLYDVHVKLDPGNASTGHIDILTHDDAPGGTFDSFFDVFVEIDLVPLGGSPALGPFFDQADVDA